MKTLIQKNLISLLIKLKNIINFNTKEILIFSILFTLPGFTVGLNKILIKIFSLEKNSNYFSWIHAYYFPEHKFLILSYLITLFIGILLILFFIKNNEKNIIINPKNNIILIVSLLLINILSLKISNITYLIIIYISWINLILISIYKFSFNIKLIRLLYILIILIVSILFISKIFYFVDNRYIIYNNNIEIIPSFLKQDNKEDLNSQKFLNSLNIYPNKSYDLENDKKIIECEEGFNFGKIKFNKENDFKEKDKSIFINEINQTLCINRKIKDEDYNYIKSRYGINKGNFNEVLFKNNKKYSEIKELTLNEEKLLKNLSFELQNSLEQFEDIYHHHFQFLSPINEYSLGRSLDQITSLYGLSFLPYFYAMKFFSDITYENFISSIFISYIIYLFFLIALIQIVFRKIQYTSMVILAFAGSILSLGYITLFTGLGYSPARYFPHLFLFYSFYLFTKKNLKIYLYLSLFIGSIGILLDSTFGVFSFLSLIGVLTVTHFRDNSSFFKSFIYLFILIIFGFLVFFYSKIIIAQSPYVAGFFDGIWGFKIPDKKIFILILFFSTLNYLLVRALKEDNVKFKIPLFCLFYSELITLYWLIFPNYGHMAIIIPPIIITILSFINLYDDNKFVQYLKVILLLGLLTYFSKNLINYNKSFNNYSNSVSNLRLFDMNFDNKKVISTINPKYFHESVNLINKYSNDNGVYIISIYDNILYWISHKYTNMPSSNMISYLNNEDIFNFTLDYLNNKKPEILFVDSSIYFDTNNLYPFDWSKIPIHPSYIPRSFEKSSRIRILNNLFFQLKNDYYLVEKNNFISVYKRKNNAL
jgi:hypothetical protein